MYTHKIKNILHESPTLKVTLTVQWDNRVIPQERVLNTFTDNEDYDPDDPNNWENYLEGLGGDWEG